MKHARIGIVGLLLVHLTTLPLSEKFLTGSESYAPTVHALPVEPFPMKISGYVKYEGYWDTRQVVGSSDDQFLLYPEPKKLDPLGRDINAKGQFESIPVQTRLRFSMEGPKIKNASGLGVVEADFFAKSVVLNN